MRGMQTSLATRLKPRASAYEHGLTNLSTSQSTYANHLVIFKLLCKWRAPKWCNNTLVFFPQLPRTPNGWLGVLFISHKSKLAVGGRFCSFREPQTHHRHPSDASVAYNALLNSTSRWRPIDSASVARAPDASIARRRPLRALCVASDAQGTPSVAQP
jgi:hypothetical protein